MAKWGKMCNWGCVVGESGVPCRERAEVERLLPPLHLGSYEWLSWLQAGEPGPSFRT
jgi:hypothetical protein